MGKTTESRISTKFCNVDNINDQLRSGENGKLYQSAPRVLFIDAYDSFAYNVITLLRTALYSLYPGQEVAVEVIRIDDARFLGPTRQEAFLEFLSGFEAVVAGPGPGHPSNEKDVGLFNVLWSLDDQHILPVLGVCLGFQSMCYAAGANVRRLKEPRHGIPTPVTHSSTSIFKDVGAIRATQYHSLHVDLNGVLRRSENNTTDPERDLWTPSIGCPDIMPLAWDMSDEDNSSVLMAAQIQNRPFWGVQFHPESVAADEDCIKIVYSFLQFAHSYRHECRSHDNRQVYQQQDSSQTLSAAFTNGNGLHPAEGTIDSSERLPKTNAFDQSAPVTEATNGHTGFTHCADSNVHLPEVFGNFDISSRVHHESVPLNDALITALVESFQAAAIIPTLSGVAILESGLRRNGSRVNQHTGKQTIIGFVADEGASHGINIEYRMRNRRLTVSNNDTVVYDEQAVDFWKYYPELMESFSCRDGPANSSFWGGCIHVVSYEAALETIDVEPDQHRVSEASSPHPQVQVDRPDIMVSIVRRSIVIDYASKTCYVQSIQPDDASWVHATALRIAALSSDNGAMPFNYDGHPHANGGHERRSQTTLPPAASLPNPVAVTLDSRHYYENKVRQCQEHIRAGDSYQLCLTAQTQIVLKSSVPKPQNGWRLFRQLIRQNPAPFAAFVRFGRAGSSLTLVSSSPERFLSCNRSGSCEFRPMKGTYLKKPGETIADARKALSVVKEQAENLMITDLIRNDMHKLLPVVQVPKLMEVEEYETVFQMISVITGEMKGSDATGLDVLHASLPPGSMTGTPKKRSCELLQAVEDHRPRGTYSGVLGYADVGGNGDNAVIIRSAFSWDDEDRRINGSGGTLEIWRIGAGGAVTAKSTPQAEYDEMVIKRAPLLRAFFPVAAEQSLARIEKECEMSKQDRLTVEILPS